MGRPSPIPAGFLVAIYLCAAGCAAEISFDSAESGARIRAIKKAAVEHDQAAIPKLIELLDSDDPAVRILAIRTLEMLTGQTMGYDHAGPEWERHGAIEAWRDWYVSKNPGVVAPLRSAAVDSDHGADTGHGGAGRGAAIGSP